MTGRGPGLAAAALLAFNVGSIAVAGQPNKAAQAASQGAGYGHSVSAPAHDRTRALTDCPLPTKVAGSTKDIDAFERAIKAAESNRAHIGALWVSRAKLEDMPTPLLVRAFRAWTVAARMSQSEPYFLPEGLQSRMDSAEIGRALVAILDAASRSPEGVAEVVGQVNLAHALAAMTSSQQSRVFDHVRTAVRAFHNDPHRAACVVQRVAELDFSKANVEFAVGPEESGQLGLRFFAPDSSSGRPGRVQLAVYDFSPGSLKPSLKDPAWALTSLFVRLAKDGVPIDVVLDRNGTFGILDAEKKARAQAMIQTLVDAGVRVTIRDSAKAGSGNHSKVATFEECVRLPSGRHLRVIKVMLGSENIGPQYQTSPGAASDGSAWWDLVAQISNLSPEAIRVIQETFDRYRREAGGASESLLSRCATAPMAPHEPGPGAVPILPMAHTPGDARYKLAVMLMMSSSPRTILVSPYATHPDVMEHILPEMAKVGKKILLVTPGENNDQPIVQAATRGFYRDLEEAGVDIGEWLDVMAHMKLGLFMPRTEPLFEGGEQGGFVVFGSSNLDGVSDGSSIHSNQELVVIVMDPRAPAELEERVFGTHAYKLIKDHRPTLWEEFARHFASQL
ncbi:MAG: hypothetical protein H6729_15150 [Deltaproteobacteria bacterium]|nr:hypothetical protein [Deltaproteobacteria bacterium]